MYYVMMCKLLVRLLTFYFFRNKIIIILYMTIITCDVIKFVITFSNIREEFFSQHLLPIAY